MAESKPKTVSDYLKHAEQMLTLLWREVEKDPRYHQYCADGSLDSLAKATIGIMFTEWFTPHKSRRDAYEAGDPGLIRAFLDEYFGSLPNQRPTPATEPGPNTTSDLWRHRAEGMRCRSCMWFCHKAGGVGRCRRHAPTMAGYPVVFSSDWRGDHKLDEQAV